jgi:hypothetical protein
MASEFRNPEYALRRAERAAAHFCRSRAFLELLRVFL